MNRTVLAGVIVAVIVVLGGGLIFLRSQNTSTKTSDTTTETMNMPMPTNNTNSTGATAPPATTPTATSAVTIQNFAFSPASITVKKGTKVTWTNKDSTAHTVTENDGQKGPDSPTVNPGDSYSFTFDTAGTFQYHCTIHPSMTGTVTVTG